MGLRRRQTNKQNSARYLHRRMGVHFATLSNNYVRSQIGSFLAGENIQTSCETPPPKEALTCISMLTVVEEILNRPRYRRDMKWPGSPGDDLENVVP